MWNWLFVPRILGSGFENVSADFNLLEGIEDRRKLLFGFIVT